MAGDWIKMRVNLEDDPAVIGIACACKINTDVVVGKLHRIWSWADQNTSDGFLPGVPGEWLDRHVRCRGFSAAMQHVGWLDIDPGGITIPKFDRHNGKSAKSRAENTERVKASRLSRDVGHENVALLSRNSRDKSRTEARPEKSKRKRRVRVIDNSKVRVTPIRVSSSDLEKIYPIAGALFKTSGYSGSDGRMFWKLAALIHRTVIAESIVIDACAGASATATSNQVGCVRNIMAEAVGADALVELLDSIWLPNECPTGPPKSIPMQEVHSLAENLTAKDDP